MNYHWSEEKAFDTKNQEHRTQLSDICAEHGENLLKYSRDEASDNDEDTLCGILEEASLHLQTAIKLDPKDRHFWILSQIFMDLELDIDAHDQLIYLLRKQPDNPHVLSSLAACEVNMNSYESALSYFKHADEVIGEMSQCTYMRAVCLFNLDRFDEAISLFQRYSKIVQDDEISDLFFYLGRCYEEGDNLEEAIKCFETSISYDEYNSRAYHPLGMIYHDNEEFENADILLENAVSIDKDSEVLIDASVVKLALDEPLEAYELLLEAHKQDPSNPYVHFFLGETQFMRGVYDDALNYYNVALALMCDHEDLKVRLGICLYHVEDIDNAELIFKKIVEETLEDPTANFYLAKIYRERKNIGLAMKYISEAFRIDPHNEEVEDLLYEIMEEQKIAGEVDELTKDEKISGSTPFVNRIFPYKSNPKDQDFLGGSKLN